MGRSTRRYSRFGKQRSRHQRRLRLEPLEDRRLLAVGTLYVDADAVGAATGDSWTDAYPDLQPALAASEALNADADPANDVAEIWIADGVYKPTEPLEADDVRTATFALVSGVSLIGGFASGETTLAERVVVDGNFQNETILSGDIGTVDDASDNAFTVVYADLASGTETTLDGLTVTAGNADESYSVSARYRNGGGGVYVFGSGELIITNSTLSGNSASNEGGGIYNDQGTLTVTNSTLSENSAYYGGGIYNDDGTLTVTNSTFSGNSASYGGGIYNYGTVIVTNSTLSGNSASVGGGIYKSYGTLTVTNSIVARNVASAGDDIDGSYTNESSLIGVEPGFVRNPSDGGDGWVDDPDTADVDESANNDHGDLRLAASSIAINLGDGSLIPADTFDLDNDGDTNEPVPVDRDGNPRVVGDVVDLGAFEFQGSPVATEPRSTAVTILTDMVDRTDGNISLREAIVYATLGGLATPVTFGASLSGGTIRLGGLELRLESDVQIDAGAVGGIGIDAGGQSRIFTVAVGASVDLNSLNITGGLADYDGGGIYNSGTLTVTNSTISGNSASSRGGGISNRGTLTVTNSTLSGNSASGNGGGIYNSGTITVTNSTLSGNSAYSGGGISNAGGTLTVTNSTISENSASSRGGGIYNFGTLSVTNSTISENSASSYGGGIYNNEGTLTVTNSTLSGNSASSGGGIYNSGTLSVTNSTISGNSASFAGGGIYNSYGTLTVTNSTISGNSATGTYSGGGGIYNRGTLTVTNSTLSENSASSRGGGIDNYSGTLTVTNSTFTGNSASSGGGIYNDEGTFTVTNSTLSGNSASSVGGGIYNYNYYYGTLTVTNSTFSGNSASSGGGIYNSNYYSGTLTVTNSTFSGNSASSGGGIYNNYGTLTVTNSTFSGNSASSGGGIYNGLSSTLTVTNSIVAGNAASTGAEVYGSYTNESSLIGVEPGFVRNPSDGGDGWVDDPDTADVDESANNDYGDLRLRPESPAIDAGSNELAVDADGNPLATDIVGNPRVLDGDGDGTATVDMGAFEFIPPVVGSYLYYRGSWFDDGPGDRAVAVDKRPLMAGQTATAANYSNFNAGINGVMVDVSTVADGYQFSADDFAFRVGNQDDPNDWVPGPGPSLISTRPGDGVADSVRVNLAWPNGVIRNTWLEVTVLANGNTGLFEDHVFYFGNAVGETGNSEADALVNAADVVAIRDNPRGELNPAGIDNPFDINRDARVDAVDLILARNNATSPLAALRLITPRVLGLAPASLPEGEGRAESGERKAESGGGMAESGGGRAEVVAKLRYGRDEVSSRIVADSRWWEWIGR